MTSSHHVPLPVYLVDSFEFPSLKCIAFIHNGITIASDLTRYNAGVYAMFRIPDSRQIRQSRQVAQSRKVNYLLSVDQDPKTAKSNRAGEGYLTAIQYLAPATVSGYQVCGASTSGCARACLHTAGVPFIMQSKNRARIARTRFYMEARADYSNCLYAEVVGFQLRCRRLGLNPAIRLNGTSDIVWERVAPWLFELFDDVQFYDYTKYEKRLGKAWQLPANYHLTFSRSESNDEAVSRVLSRNRQAKVAVVFSTSRFKSLPKQWNGFRVLDADKHDLRFLDKGARILGLRAKGDARRDNSGFVVKVESSEPKRKSM